MQVMCGKLHVDCQESFIRKKEEVMNPDQRYLSGMKVLDLSQYLPGPFAAQILADLGAEVVKVEPPAGDPMRGFMFVDEDGISPFYKQVNAGKSVIRLDLKTATDRSVFERLVQTGRYPVGILSARRHGTSRVQPGAAYGV